VEKCRGEGISITPKLHLLESHVMDFIQSWGRGLQYFGEQGGEKLHKEFNRYRNNCFAIKGAGNKLVSQMKQHLANISPELKQEN